MSIIGKYRWGLSFLGLSILKRALRHRVSSPVEISLKDLPPGVKMVNRIDFIFDFCAGKKVLHIGFVDHPFTEERIRNGNLLHLQLKEVTHSLVGFDNETEAIQKYVSMTGDENVINGDLLEMSKADLGQWEFDIVLLGEVLEHLRNPSLAIERLYQNLPPDTIFLVTVPNYTSLDAIAGSLHQKESVHPDHYCYFSPYTLLRLFPRQKFELLQFVFAMYFQKNKDINFVLRSFPFMGDCMIGVFKKK